MRAMTDAVADREPAAGDAADAAAGTGGPTDDVVLSVEGLRKEFGGLVATDDATFEG